MKKSNLHRKSAHRGADAFDEQTAREIAEWLDLDGWPAFADPQKWFGAATDRADGKKKPPTDGAAGGTGFRSSNND